MDGSAKTGEFQRRDRFDEWEPANKSAVLDDLRHFAQSLGGESLRRRRFGNRLVLALDILLRADGSKSGLSAADRLGLGCGCNSGSVDVLLFALILLVVDILALGGRGPWDAHPDGD